jgi:methyl-accepting chemotaxis protein
LPREGPGTTLDFTLVTAGVLIFVIAAAALTATTLTRSVRAPVARAISAADRLARGEFTARMGASGPQELIKLGRAFDDMAGRLEHADSDQRQSSAVASSSRARRVAAASSD